ncbi:hypothetical protein KUCAC02_036358, partial [Chaenocephalus aceratus]
GHRNPKPSKRQTRCEPGATEVPELSLNDVHIPSHSETCSLCPGLRLKGSSRSGAPTLHHSGRESEGRDACLRLPSKLWRESGRERSLCLTFCCKIRTWKRPRLENNIMDNHSGRALVVFMEFMCGYNVRWTTFPGRTSIDTQQEECCGYDALLQNVKVTSLLKPKQEAGVLQSSNRRRAVRCIIPQRGGGVSVKQTRTKFSRQSSKVIGMSIVAVDALDNVSQSQQLILPQRFQKHLNINSSEGPRSSSSASGPPSLTPVFGVVEDDGNFCQRSARSSSTRCKCYHAY